MKQLWGGKKKIKSSDPQLSLWLQSLKSGKVMQFTFSYFNFINLTFVNL